MLGALMTMGGLGIVSGVGLGIASKIFAVQTDPREDQIAEILPSANCGACGFPGCRGLAAAIVAGAAGASACPVSNKGTSTRIASIMGLEIVEDPLGPKVAKVKCGGGCGKAVERFEYDGIKDCIAALAVSGGSKACMFGCVGLGTCERVCPFGAIEMREDNLPEINKDKCTGCGICVRECPKSVIGMVPVSLGVVFSCNSTDSGKAVKDVCSAGCITCGICQKVCPYEAVVIKDGHVTNDYAKCVDCGLCVKNCPTKAIADFRTPMKAFINDTCIGCSSCLKACPTNAISGQLKNLHKVNENACIGCGICEKVCPTKKSVDMIKADKKELQEVTA